MTDAKIVHLNKGTERPTNAVAGRVPAALVPVRDKSANQLKQALQTLFDNADDTLFEMADRAVSNAEQNAFFEAMRDLRLKRKSIERDFLQGVFDAFAALNEYRDPRASAQAAQSFESLSLVQNDELEETVAVDAMVAKVLNRDQISLGHLTVRLNTQVTRKLDDQANPIGPTALCHLFLNCCRNLGVEIKVKLIILKLFEKYVLSGLDQLYAEANQALVEAGVLPELKSLPPRKQIPRANRGNPVKESAAVSTADVLDDAGHDEGLHEVFGALQSLLADAREHSGARRQVPAGATPITSNDLLRLLSHIQLHLPSSAQADVDMRGQLDHLLQRASAKTGRTRVVAETDNDVINLVSMLFEFILDDRTLPDSLKALIARLQIPIVKVALLDKTFFSRGGHPARRLLNEIASAAMGWSAQGDLQRDNLYVRIEQVVQRLLHDFTDDPAIFNELLTEFLSYTKDERRRSDLLEQRTRDAEEGRAKAELARQQVEQALNERLVGKNLPEVVVQLLQEAWSKVLLLSCLKHGYGSEQWNDALRTMDQLLWSVEPHEESEARLQLLELVPSLLRSLREGLASAAFDPFSTSEFFKQLEALHVQALQRLRPNRNGAGEAIAEPALDLPGPAAAVLSVTQDPMAMVHVVEEIVLEGAGEPLADGQTDFPIADDEALHQVDSLRVGSWVEIQEDDEHRIRCKLAAIIRPAGKYVFVNRTGMKVLEKTRTGLAVEFRRNAVRVLDDALLFDRALASVIGNLRRMKEA
ncbi:DUF1631 domain-containing protein [Pseudomonas matsuisoli]|uniref:Thymidine phosphorylase n=1 Tax=Pseudomonas matsuisoli TaxID=1515666 RepID=A0A917UYK7_9PSED|nr:DUF1631 domain-containing protein [Pseudomonas matsuisoli]GGJ96912.1 hypothetical protein GCM10009304_23500 [Pseudomonas matsuisoli]